jgi:hypothetical protein
MRKIQHITEDEMTAVFLTADLLSKYPDHLDQKALTPALSRWKGGL